MAILVQVIFPPDPGEGRMWSWGAPGPSVTEALHQTWRAFNLVERDDPHAARHARSMMVGDVIAVADTTFVVEPTGFSVLTPQESVTWVMLPWRQRMFGTASARAQGWLSGGEGSHG